MAINDGLTISVRELFQLFPDANAAREYIQSRIWPDGPVCPFCRGADRVAERNGKGGFYRCAACRKDFSCLKGTVFESSHIPLDKWIHGMYLLLTSRKGVSSMQLSKELSISQTAAWFLLHRLREACGNDMTALKGTVEIDETYIGGKEKNKHQYLRVGRGTGFVGKQSVVGMRERGGRTKAFHLDSITKATIHPLIMDNVERGATLNTDENAVYDKIRTACFTHLTISHKDGVYHDSKRNVGTNSIESVWAVLKRGLHGTYHHASNKHLARYVNEFAFRLSDGNVKTHVLLRLNALVDQCVGVRVRYSELTA